MSRVAFRVMLGIMAALTTSSPALAQDRAEDVQRRVRVGDTVWILDEARIEREGRVLSVDDSALRIAIEGQPTNWNLADAREVWRSGDSLKNGSLIGLAVGSAIGGIGGACLASLLSNEGHPTGGPFLFLLGVGAGGGIAIGAGIDALIHGRTLVYQQPSRVTLTPVITTQAKVVQFRVGF
jgi:hypothetical protein